MPRYVIHIGPPKVGSKYLQSSLAALSKDEVLPDGIHYPTRLLSPTHQISHQPVLDAIKTGSDSVLEEAIAELNRSQHRFVVLSCEGFFGLTLEQLSYLRRLLDGSPVQFVYYCRRWSERIPSLWKQEVKEGRFTTFPERYAREIQNPAKHEDPNPRITWDRFAQVFGRESLSLVSFNNLVEHQIDLVEHFLTTFIDCLPLKKPRDVFSNKSPSTTDTEALRALNAIHFRTTGKIDDRTVRIQFLKLRSSLDFKEIESAMENDIGMLTVSDHAAPFIEVYNQLLTYQDRLISKEFGSDFFKKKSIQQQYIQQNYLLDDGVVEKLKVLYSNLMR